MKVRRHPRSKESIVSSITLQQIALMLGCFAAVAVTVEASQPGWWTSSGAVNGSATAADYSAVAQGQLKQFTEKAVLYLDANLTNGAGSTLDGMVAGWSNSYRTNGYSATNPAPRDRLAINQAQLKTIANLVYGRLATNGYYGLVPNWIHTNAHDLQLANQAQLKTVFNFDITTPPAAIGNLTAYSSTNGAIQLAWTLPATNNANGITLQQTTNGGVTWTTVTTLSSTNTAYQAAGLDTNAFYSFQVMANNGGGAGTSASTTPGTPTPQIPAAPTALVGTMGDFPNMNLSWFSSLGASSYLVQRQEVSSGSWTNLATSTTISYSDATYSNGGYHYRVCASNSAGLSAPSEEIPRSRYAVIDLGTNRYPMYVNNAGSVVLGSNGDMPPFTYWTNGATQSIDLATVADMNNTGQVVGTTTSVIAMTGNNGGDPFTEYVRLGGIWTPGTGMATLPAPTVQFVKGSGLSQSSLTSTGVTSHLIDIGDNVMTITPTSITDDGKVFGLVEEGFRPPNLTTYTLGAADADFTARLDSSISPIPENYMVYGDGLTEGYSHSAIVGGVRGLGLWVAANGKGLGYQVTVAEGAYISQVPEGQEGPIYIGDIFGGPPYENYFIDFDHPEPYGPVYYDGSGFQPIVGIPSYMSDNGHIIGYADTNYASAYLWTNGPTTPTTIPHGIVGPINSQDQIVSGNQYWETNQISNLNDLLPIGGGWNGFGAGDINDGGAIVGTATYSGTNSAIATGSHGVMLVQMDIVVETELGSGQYLAVPNVTSYEPFDGVGRGAPNSAGVQLPTSLVQLSGSIASGSVDTLSVKLVGPAGAFTGTLTETSANSLVFTNSGSTVSVSLSQNLTLNSTAIDAMEARVTSTSLGFSGDGLTFVETNVNSKLFALPLQQIGVTLTASPSPGTVDSLQSAFSLQALISGGLGSIGSYESQSFATRTYTETGANTLTYQGSGGLSIALVNFTTLSTTVADSIEVRISGTGLPSGGILATLKETAVNSLQFAWVPASVFLGTDLPANDPAVTGSGVHFIRAKGWPAGMPLTLHTSLSDQTVSFTPMPSDPGTMISDKFIVVPAGTTNYPTIKTLLAASESPGSGALEKLEIKAVTQIFFPGVPLQKTMFMGRSLVGDYETNNIVDVNPLNQPIYHHITESRAQASSNLYLQNNIYRDESMTKADVLAALPAFSMWYSYGHSYVNDLTEHKFTGFATMEGTKIAPEDVKGLVADKNASYTFVWLNGCVAAQPSSPGVTSMINAFNAKVYVGWNTTVDPIKAARGATAFFTALHLNTTVKDALVEANNVHANPGQWDGGTLVPVPEECGKKTGYFVRFGKDQ